MTIEILNTIATLCLDTMERTIYRVAVDCVNCTKGPHKVRVLVIAEDAHEALDRATEHPNAKELYDEPIQRSIVDGEISESRVERKYGGYIEEVEYVGEV